jgi:hypothetical protein
MKHLLIIPLAILMLASFRSANEEYFEGMIVYEHTYETDDPRINVKQLEQFFGTKSEFYYKNGNFLQLFNGSFMISDVYHVKENKSYSKLKGNDTLFVNDCSQPNETITESTTEDVKDTILGKKCKAFYFKSKNLKGEPYRQSKFVFSTEPKINYALFTNFKFASYNVIYPALKALPLSLKSSYAGQPFRIKMTAVSIKKTKLDDKFFALPFHTVMADRKK